MATLSLLPVELIYCVTSYLDECEIVYFMRTSKHFYSVLRRRVWSTFTFHEYWRDVSNYLAKLADLTREVGTDVLGYHHIKKIEVLTPRNSFGPSQSRKSGFHDILLGLIESGKIDLREIYIRGNGINGWPQIRYDEYDDTGKCNSPSLVFLRRIKEYAQSKSIREFSMNIATSNILSLVEADVVEFRLLTKLSVCMTLDFRRPPEYETTPGQSAHINQGDRYLATLPGVLNQTAELRELRFRANIGRCMEDGPGSIHDPKLAEPLENLQTAIGNLKRLRVLKIGNDESTDCTSEQIFFHPSFFMIPPETCEVVEYYATVSVAWWRKFASHHFSGVKQLKLNITPMGLEGRWWVGGDSVDLRLYSVAVAGLKEFVVDAREFSGADPDRHKYPRDLIDCVKRKNNCSIVELTGTVKRPR
ncbi:hypothetical protein TWF970_003488 [Orbilia oligospora]|uniref:F-box domain-containing protein n=1 Tax=Orbilia oligospora TaxID=2813651 RepID=A0A7C8VPU3_ORBOL|nr:hypothetical protein TWF970_003488 [Orbilia oligospora]